MSSDDDQEDDMEQYVSRFLSDLTEKRNYSEHTVAAYSSDIGQFLRFAGQKLGAPVKPEAISPELVQAYVEDLQHGDGKYAPSSVARKMAAVKSFFQYLADQSVIQGNPASQLVVPKVRKNLPKTLSQEEMQKLMAAARKDTRPKSIRDHALLAMLCATGMRVTEVVNVLLADVDWEQGMVRCHGRGGRERRIPLSIALEPLAEYRDHARPALKLEESPDTLFLNHRGQRLTRQGVWLILKEAAEEAGIRAEVTPHTLRHSFAKYLVGAGEDMRRVQELLGHANLSTTLVYRQATAPSSEAQS
jgi:integrase/recombinase XerD